MKSNISIDTCTRHHNLFFLPTFFGAFFRIRAALVVMKFSNLHIKSSITLPIVLEFILFLPRNVNEELYIIKYHLDLMYCVTLNENVAIPNKCYKSSITYQWNKHKYELWQEMNKIIAAIRIERQGKKQISSKLCANGLQKF